MPFVPEIGKTSLAGLKAQGRRRLLLVSTIVVCSAMLLAVLAVTVVDAINKGSDVHANAAVHVTPTGQVQEPQDAGYPDPTDQSGVPASVKVTDSGEEVVLSAVVTEGRQIYECQSSKTDPSGYAWKNLAPFALLKAKDGTNVIHSTDPTWLYTEDGSEVKAQVVASATPDPSAIPWLRLSVTEHRGGQGLFSTVDQIQRLYTKAGKAPATGCDRAAALKHTIASVAYTAEYVFWGQGS